MNADPRRTENVLRYAPKANGNGQEELAPDYKNTLGHYQTTGNVTEGSLSIEPNLQGVSGHEEVQLVTDDPTVTTNATNVIATSPQYGVAIIPNSNPGVDLPPETITVPTETLTDTTTKPTEEKELHSTPSRNDRFKVVKIASLEPFKRGRWKCMDYVDEAPPAGAARVPQSTGSIQITTGQYMQTQSLPQQQIQQMLLQGGFTNGTQFFTNVPPQMVPQGQYFYPQVANMQSQTLPQQVPAQFIANQPYFAASVLPNATGFTVPQGFQNVQYVPANLIPNQNSAFVPTTQSVQLAQNFQQSQSYSQSNNANQPLVNGHNFNPTNEQVAASLPPTQNVKNVILNSNNSQSAPVTQQTIQSHIQGQANAVQGQANAVQGQANAVQGQQQYSHQNVFQQMVQPQNTNQTAQPVQIQMTQSQGQGAPAPGQSFDHNLSSNVYTNPQFAVSVNSLTVLDSGDNQTEATAATNEGGDSTSENTDDPAKTNPVVNAIDNKIEQAMDLVKSHLMYTVREEVEVLKEKIAELMERIQQLETENNYLRSQIPKTQSGVAPAASGGASSSLPPPSAANFSASSNGNPVASTVTPVTNPISNTQPVSDAPNQQQ